MRGLALFIPTLALVTNSCRESVGLDVLPPPSFRVLPSTVAPGDSFAVVFTLRNPTDRTVSITSGAGCLFFLRAFQDSSEISVQGLTYFCTAGFRTFQVPPHDSLQAVRRGVAAERTGTATGTPLRAGTYRIRTLMNAALPEMEAPLTVVDTGGAT